jgi:hypothetical protein
MRIKFMRNKQREFLDLVLEKSNCPSLRELMKRGFDVSYSSLKNYYVGRRFLSKELFEELCSFAGLNKSNISYEIIENNWGQVKGGKKSRKINKS